MVGKYYDISIGFVNMLLDGKIQLKFQRISAFFGNFDQFALVLDRSRESNVTTRAQLL
jgi:hypothetical protein